MVNAGFSTQIISEIFYFSKCSNNWNYQYKINVRLNKKIKLLNTFNATSENICEKYLLAFSESTENLSALIDHSLPIICDRQLFGNLLHVEESMFGATVLITSRVSGYKDWIEDVVYNELYGITTKGRSKKGEIDCFEYSTELLLKIISHCY